MDVKRAIDVFFQYSQDLNPNPSKKKILWCIGTVFFCLFIYFFYRTTICIYSYGEQKSFQSIFMILTFATLMVWASCFKHILFPYCQSFRNRIIGQTEDNALQI